MKGMRERGCDGEERKILASKILHVHYKTFYLKVIKENHGTFLEITESSNQRTSQIVLGLSAAKQLRSHIKDFVDFYATLLSVSRIPSVMDTILKSVMMKKDKEKKIYLNFKENARGRFLKICRIRLASWGRDGCVEYLAKKKAKCFIHFLLEPPSSSQQKE